MAKVIVANFKRGTPGLGNPEDSLRKGICHMQFTDWQVYDNYEAMLKIRNDPENLDMQKRAYVSFILPITAESWLKQMMEIIPLDRMPAPSDVALGAMRHKHSNRLWIKDSGLARFGLTRKQLISFDQLDWIDGTGLNLEDDTLFQTDGCVPNEYLGSEMVDRAAVSSGSYTVGASGANYATWALALGDVNNLTGNLTFTQIANTTDTGKPYPNKNLNGYTLLITVDSSWHKGDFNNNVRKSSFSYTADHWMLYSGPPSANNGTIIYENLYAVPTANSPASYFTFIAGGQNRVWTQIWRNIIIDGNTYNWTGIGHNDTFNKLVAYYHNCICSKLVMNQHALVFNGCASSVAENCTVYGCVKTGAGPGGYDYYCGSRTYTNYNLLSINNENASASGLLGTNANNATTFAAETGFQRLSLSAAEIVMSIEPTDGQKFLQPRVHPTYLGLAAGTKPTIAANTTDIAGRARPNSRGQYWIGAKDGVPRRTTIMR